MRKILSNLAVSEYFFEFNYFQIGQHVVLLRVNYIAHEVCLGVQINS